MRPRIITLRPAEMFHRYRHSGLMRAFRTNPHQLGKESVAFSVLVPIAPGRYEVRTQHSSYGNSESFGVTRGLVAVGPPLSSMTFEISPRLSRATVIMW